MYKAYICSPLRAETAEKQEANRLAALGYCVAVEQLIGNVKAIAPHAYIPLMLDDSAYDERKLALEFGLNVLGFCQSIFVCGNTISEGMKGEILEASRLAMPIYVMELTLLENVKAIANQHKNAHNVKSVYELIYEVARE